MSVSEVAAVLCVLGAVFCIGGTVGLWMGWSHRDRMDKWAARVVAVNERELAK